MAETPTRFVSIKQFCDRTGLSRGTVYNMVQRGEMPRPVRLTENRVAFPAEIVDAWCASKLEAA